MTWFEFSKDKIDTALRVVCLVGSKDDDSSVRAEKSEENQSRSRKSGRCKKVQLEKTVYQLVATTGSHSWVAIKGCHSSCGMQCKSV